MTLPTRILVGMLTLLLSVSACKADGPADGSRITTAAGPKFDFQGSFEGPLGLQLYSVRNYTSDDVRGTLEQVRAMGFQEIEMGGTYGLTPREFRRLLEEIGLFATAMHADYDRLREDAEAVLDVAEILGVDFVGVSWIPHEGNFGEEDARTAAADFNRWGNAAAARGMTFFYHVHGYEFRENEEGVTPFDIMVAETDTHRVKYEMDVFWTALPGVDPAELLRKNAGRWRLMHIKDLREDWPLGDHSGQAPEEADVPVGTGQIDWPDVLRAAREAGVERYYLEDESPDPLNNLPQSVRYLETVRF